MADTGERCEIEIDSPEGTERLGSWFGRHAWPGLLFDLRGELGAGKTCFVRGLARALGGGELASSPTFNICHVYEGSLRLYHFDAYRIERPEEVLEHGFDEMLAAGVVAVEWGGRLRSILPGERLELEWRHVGPSARRVSILGFGKQQESLVRELRSKGFQ